MLPSGHSNKPLPGLQDERRRQMRLLYLLKSDVHQTSTKLSLEKTVCALQPKSPKVRVCFRIDGALQPRVKIFKIEVLIRIDGALNF